MKVESLAIADVKLITPRQFRDDRGFFSETWNRRIFEQTGIVADFVQDNYACSLMAGTVRGLHFQVPPMAQGKLVRVVRGAIMDVAVDLRRSSSTFGQHVSAVLSAENWTQIWVPKGFAHGYVTLEPDTEVAYKVTGYYAPGHDAGILWNDPALGIDWRLGSLQPLLSAKDRDLPPLSELYSPFE